MRLALCYLMTLSALTNTFGGIVRPICFAVFRLMTSSNFVGCSTGRSAGFAPLEDLVDVGSGAPVQVGIAHAVAHKPTVFHKFWLRYIAGSRLFTARSTICFR